MFTNLRILGSAVAEQPLKRPLALRVIAVSPELLWRLLLCIRPLSEP